MSIQNGTGSSNITDQPDNKTEMVAYYAKRAEVYERIYAKPERQANLKFLQHFIGNALAGERVYEVACGTGYWSAFIARSAAEILATDINQEVLDLARRKHYGKCPVSFQKTDAYAPKGGSDAHTAGFHGFWWSHIPLSRTAEFLQRFHSRLLPGSRVVMLDNAYVEGSNTPVSRTDEMGNTYQIRKLDDGTEHEVLKNFPSDAELRAALSPYAAEITITRLQYYWLAEYRLAA